MTSAKDFIKDFDKLYKNDRTSIFKLFQEGGFSLSEQNEIFSKLSNKNKCKLYNMLSLDARDRYYKFVIELNLLDEGLCTRDWSIEQIKDISSIKQNPISMNFESSVWD